MECLCRRAFALRLAPRRYKRIRVRTVQHDMGCAILYAVWRSLIVPWDT